MREIVRKIIRFTKNWFIPPSVWKIVLKLFTTNNPSKNSPILMDKNIELINKHRGERLFILCNGPSIKKENLLPLKNEISMSVSNFYFHKDYLKIQPKYHIIPRIYFNQLEPVNENPIQKTIQWLKEMDSSIGSATMFLDYHHQDIVIDNKLFPNRNLYYINTLENFTSYTTENIDIKYLVPPVQSVPILCLVLALNMGFREIYLLGVDHNALCASRYDYFFDRSKVILKEPSAKEDGSNSVSRLMTFKILTQLWTQYLELKIVADQMGVQITNLSQESFLDVFPIKRLEDVI